MAFTVSKIDHIGVACKDLEVSKKFYTDILGLECTGEEAVGQGIQHVALLVDDLVAAIADVQAKGGVMIDKAPRGGAGGMDIAFVHPKSVGILLELCTPHKA